VLAAPAPTVSEPRDVPDRHRSTVIRALGAAGTFAVAGLVFAVLHGTGHLASSHADAPAPPIEVVMTPPPAPTVADPPPRAAAAGEAERPAAPTVAEPAADSPDDPPQGIPGGAHAVVPGPHPATSRLRTAPRAGHLGAQGAHAATWSEAAAAPAGPVEEGVEPAPAHGPDATRPAVTPPDPHAPAVAAPGPGSGSPPEAAPPQAQAPAAPAIAAPAAPVARKDEIDVAATRAAVRSHVAAIQQCYERAKMDDPGLAGAMTMRISIAPDGGVTGAQVASSTIRSPVVERCVTAEISRWRLPRPTAGNTASFLYPFVFE
jgi:hypothetical protein